MEELHITSVRHFDTKKDGTKMVSKNGKPYWRAAIRTQEHPDKELSGLVFEQLAEGQTIKATISQSGQYWNFELAKETKTAGDSILLDKIYQEVYAARQEIVMVRQLLQKSGALPTVQYPADEIDPQDTPF